MSLRWLSESEWERVQPPFWSARGHHADLDVALDQIMDKGTGWVHRTKWGLVFGNENDFNLFKEARTDEQHA
jgi:hypothetical protein